MRKAIAIIALISLVATGALAAKLPAEMAKSTNQKALGHADKGYLFEGFEGAFPPAGWTLSSTNAMTWEPGTSGVEGTVEAHVTYDSAAEQDEILSVDYDVEAGDDLFFWTMGNQYWASSANFTVTVNGDVVYDLLNDTTFYTSAFSWYPVEIDLAAYEGMNVTVQFRYAGIDGADQHFDAVVFGTEGWAPPAPEDVEFCDMLIEAQGSGTFTGDTCDGVNLIESLECGNYTESGLEAYYEVFMPAGATFTATVTNTADGALWVLADCVGPEGVFECLGYADDTVSGQPEVVTYTNEGSEDMVVYLVIDSYSDSCGEYTMEFVSDGGAVATEEVSMDGLKALYR